MGLIWLRARSEWRRHFWGLVALTLLIGLVGSVVLAAVAGARRTRSSVERLDAATHAANAFVDLEPGRADVAASVETLPEVEVADRYAPMAFFNEQGQLPLVASVAGALGDTLNRDRVLRGRRADPAEALEVTLPEPIAQHLGLDVGGSLPLTGISPEQTACAFGQSPPGDARCAQFNQAFFGDPPDFSAFAGPRLRLRVVGITRGLNDVAARPDDSGMVVLTPAFYRAYGTDTGGPAHLVARLRTGTTLQQFETAATRVAPPEAIANMSGTAAVFDGLQSTVGVLANGLLAFAAAVAIAGFAAIAQTISRRTASGASERTVLSSLGMTRRALTVDAVAPLVPVALIGATLATIAGWLASMRMPIGTARRAEPHPGLHFDPAVLVGGALLLAVVVLGVSTLAVLWVSRRSARHPTRRRVRGSSVVGGVPAMVGRRFALDTRAADRIPARSALAGVALGVAGVVAVATFGAGLTRLGHEPARYGWAWDMTISGERASDPETPQPPPAATSTYWQRAAKRIAADRDVASVTQMWFGFPARVDDRTVSVFAERRHAGDTGFVIVTGRAPVGADEVALGARTLRRAHIGLGDHVRVAGKPMRVVGQAVFPVTSDGYALADGALLSAEGFDALRIPTAGGFGSSGNNSFAVALRPGADRAAATARLTALNRGDAPELSRRPQEVDQLEQLDRLPVILAAFLLLVALLALGHALVLTVRHRRRDLAVLRVVGFTPSQTARTVAWQASTTGAVGALIGVPLGLILGRVVWAAIAHGYGIAADTAWPWLVVALALPLTVLFANALAWWPGRRAARVHPAEILRSE